MRRPWLAVVVVVVVVVGGEEDSHNLFPTAYFQFYKYVG